MSTEPIRESTAESENAESDLRSLERSNRARPLERVASVLEILFVALFGPLVASLVFWAIDQTNVLASSGIVFAFASCEALVTLGVIFVLVRLDEGDSATWDSDRTVHSARSPSESPSSRSSLRRPRSSFSSSRCCYPSI